MESPRDVFAIAIGDELTVKSRGRTIKGMVVEIHETPFPGVIIIEQADGSKVEVGIGLN